MCKIAQQMLKFPTKPETLKLAYFPASTILIFKSIKKITYTCNEFINFLTNCCWNGQTKKGVDVYIKSYAIKILAVLKTRKLYRWNFDKSIVFSSADCQGE